MCAHARPHTTPASVHADRQYMYGCYSLGHVCKIKKQKCWDVLKDVFDLLGGGGLNVLLCQYFFLK